MGEGDNSTRGRSTLYSIEVTKENELFGSIDDLIRSFTVIVRKIRETFYPPAVLPKPAYSPKRKAGLTYVQERKGLEMTRRIFDTAAARSKNLKNPLLPSKLGTIG